MIRWIPYTFVRTVLFFIGGILLGYRYPETLTDSWCLVLILVLAVLYFVVVLAGRSMRRLINPGWIALPLIFLLGYAHLLWQTESRGTDHMVGVKERISGYEAVITRYAEEKEKSWKLEARVTKVRTTRWENKEGNIVLYFSKSDFPVPFQYGDVLLIKGHPQQPDGPANPGEFDYRRYLALKNIYHQQFIRRDGALKVGHNPPNIAMDFAFRGREWAERTLNRFVHGERQQAIASALVLGVTDGLDNELLNAYAATGSMHILAVSGLHISIIYFILLRIFTPLGRLPGGRWMVAFISLAVLWLYAFVTGLSPSVLRAVTMFSFLAVARPWARSSNVYNTLAVSAFCMLLFDPFLIFSVGFQLSYLAVLGIVYIYPRILSLWEPDHALTVEIWKVSAVSIAAQIATFPLGLLYFHQFPNYFILSNLLVVPLSFVVLIIGLIVLTVSFISPIAIALGYCLEGVIRFLNGVVFVLEDFPFSITPDIYITGWQCLLLMTGITAILALFEYRKFGFVVFAFVSFAAFAALQWKHFYEDIASQQMTVYKVPGQSALDLSDDGQTSFVADSGLRRDLNKMRYHILPNRLANGIRGETTILQHRFEGGSLIVWNGKRILQVQKEGAELPRPLEVDWIIIGHDAIDIQTIIEGVTCKTIILDSSNSFLFASRFLEAAKLHKLDVHSVLHDGAFNIKIEKQDS